MRYLITVIDDTTDSATRDEIAAIDAFNERLRANGHWVLAGGLASPGTAIVIDNRAGADIVTDGPLADLAEYPSGFWIVDVPDRDVARQLAADGSRSCNRKVELRPFLGS